MYKRQVVDCFENVVNILAVSGDNALGGNDFDAAIAHMYCQKNGIDYQALQPRQRAILLRQAEQCKQLSLIHISSSSLCSITSTEAP